MIALRARLAVDSRCRLGEGIVWCDRRRVLYWTDIESARLWQHDPASGESHAWSLPDRLCCLALCEDDRLLLGMAKGLYILHTDPAPSPPPALLVEVEADDPHTRLNDGRTDRHGNFVFGTKDEHPDGRRGGHFYQYSARHGLRTLALPNAAIPNSICFDRSGKQMYFCDSVEPRILHCHYDPESATVSGIETFVELDQPGASPDGSIIDAEDAVWNAQWGAGRVVRYLPDGRIDRIVEVPTRNASCCTIGGKTLDTLYITTAREELDAATLECEPQAGGVFACALGQPFGRKADRMHLPAGPPR